MTAIGSDSTFRDQWLTGAAKDWDDRLDVAGNHVAAALALLKDMGNADRRLVMGSHTDDSYVFIQLPAGTVAL